MSEWCSIGYSATLARAHVHNFICSENRGFPLLREQGFSFTREPMQRGHLNGSQVMPRFCKEVYSAMWARARGHDFKS